MAVFINSGIPPADLFADLKWLFRVNMCDQKYNKRRTEF